MNRRTLIQRGIQLGLGTLASTALPGAHAVAASGKRGEPVATETTGKGALKAVAAARGLLLGCAVDTTLMRQDAAYQAALREQFNCVVGENCMKFGPTQPQPGTYFFDDADALVRFAEENHMKIRGHNFVWHEAKPAWLDATLTRENAASILTNHIRTVGGRYRGKVHSWDVVNEAIWLEDGRPDGLRTASPWFQTLGEQYLALAFRTAHETDPKALLTYNEYGIESDSDSESRKRAATLALLKRLKAAGVPVHALGVQSHLRAGSPASYAKGAAELTQGAQELGLKLFVTEMDVKDDSLESDNIAVRDAAVASVYSTYLDAMLQSKATHAVLTWGVSDAHTWLNRGTRFREKHPTRKQRPLLLDDADAPKPAFYAMRQSLWQASKR
ncbi:MAG: endo-1,4-beta-xylanase [Acidobacteriota bacterium]|nr:endo-1,4-beta-xylanase [Acidobacteriota bacterium]